MSGALLTWAHDFVGHEVHTQLAAQKIFFPPAGSPAIKAPEFAAMRQYAGQQLTTGAQAETYADHFIANHAATLFQGETLRGLLLNAYAFATMGMIAGIAAIAAFIAAAVMLILGALGPIHARRVSPTTELLAGHPERTRPGQPASAPAGAVTTAPSVTGPVPLPAASTISNGHRRRAAGQ